MMTSTHTISESRGLVARCEEYLDTLVIDRRGQPQRFCAGEDEEAGVRGFKVRGYARIRSYGADWGRVRQPSPHDPLRAKRQRHDAGGWRSGRRRRPGGGS